jgi:hypothetical protein
MNSNSRLSEEWSGRWESNPRLKLGKLGYYHYTTPATRVILGAFLRVGKCGNSRSVPFWRKFRDFTGS